MFHLSRTACYYYRDLLKRISLLSWAKIIAAMKFIGCPDVIRIVFSNSNLLLVLIWWWLYVLWVYELLDNIRISDAKLMFTPLISLKVIEYKIK